MVNINCLKADCKQILREPILIIFIFIPLFLFVILKKAIVYLMPYIDSFAKFDLSNYYNYVLAVSFIMISSMLGTVFGFLMLDERDGHITELMIITPIGYTGYIFNRIFLPMVFSIFYTILGYYILNIYHISFIRLLLLAFLIGIETLLIGLTLFNLADDKVKGLTYSKALSIVTLFALADLINKSFISFIAALFPFYWISKVINSPLNQGNSLVNIFLAIIVHVIWLIIYLKLVNSKSLL